MAFGDADASTPAFVKANAVSKAATTASFTPPAGALLVACAWHDTAGGNVTNTSQVTDSLGLTWTRRLTVSKQDDGTGFANGHLAVSTAVATGAAMTVTTTGTNTNNPAALYVRVVTAADTTTPMDATPAEGTNTNAVISQAITTATDGARVFLIATDWNLAANMTAGASQTAVVADGIGAPDMRVYLGVRSAVTSPAGSVTMSTATPTTGNTNNFAVFAIRPAAGGGTTHNADAAVSATATVTSAAAVDRPASVASTVTATRTAAAAIDRPVAATVTATSTRAATAAVDRAAAAASTTTATLSTAATVDRAATAVVTATASVAAAAAVDRPAVAALTATASITASADISGRVDGDAAVTVTASMAAALAVTAAAAAAGTIQAVIAAAATVDRAIAAAFTVAASISVQSDGAAARATSSAAVTARRTSTDGVSSSRTSTDAVTAAATSTGGVT